MIQYCWDPTIARYRLERRHATTIVHTNSRSRRTESFTSEQYAHLRECLQQRQRVKALLGNRERKARHFLYATTAAFIAYIFAAPDFTIPVEGITITARQIAALFPLLIAYLILYACHTGATHLRLRYECRLLDAELQKFGCPTADTISQRLRHECSPPQPSIFVFLSTSAYNIVYWIHDVFFAASVLVALTGSAYIAVGIYRDLANVNFPIAVIVIAYLALAATAAVAAPLALRYARRTRQLALDAYLKTQTPVLT
jgi:hypothetical protein